MTDGYTHIIDLAQEIDPPEDGILSKVLFESDQVKAVLFGFGEGEGLSEHSASVPAIVHFVKGEAAFTLGEDPVEATPGTWIHMNANLKHSVEAKTPVIMLLLMLKNKG